MKTSVNGTVTPSLMELLDFAATANLAEVVWEQNGRRIAFKRGVHPVDAPPPAATATPAPNASVEPKRNQIRSPMVGTFLRASKDRPPLVVEGDAVSPGQRLAIVEAMQVPKDVICSVKGRILRVLVENGRPVEYGQPLFELDGGEEGAERV